MPRVFNVHSLRFRLIFWLIVGCGALLAVALAGSYVVLRGLILREANREALATTERVANGLAGVFRQVEITGAELGYGIEVTNLGRERIEGLLEARVTQNPAVLGALVALEPGAFGGPAAFAIHLTGTADGVVRRDLMAEAYEFRAQDWYRRTLAEDRAWWSDPYLNETAGNVWVVSHNVPLKRGLARALGMVSLDLPIARLHDTAAALGLGRDDPRLRATIFDRNGQIVQSFNRELEFKVSAEQLVADGRGEGYRPLLAALAARSAGFFEHEVPDVGRRTTTYAPVGDTGWMVGSSIDHSLLLAPLDDLFFRLVAAALGLFALLLVVVVTTTRRMVRPLEQLTASAAHFAAGEFDWPLPPHDARDEVGVLVQALGNARDSLKRHIAELAEATAARQKLDSELSIAREIQMAMLPRDHALDVEGRRLEIAAVLEPAKAVGGDFYNYFAIDERLIGFYIGDVSDKGVPAALFMARASTLLEVALRRLASPGAVLADVGRHLAGENETGMFATVLCGMVDVGIGMLTLASAGHDPPLRMRADGRREWLPVGSGPALGFEVEAEYPEWRGRLAAGDALVAFTDGVTEAFDGGGIAFGTGGIEGTLVGTAESDAHALAGLLRVAVRNFEGDAPPSDDLTVLVLRYRPTADDHAVAA